MANPDKAKIVEGEEPAGVKIDGFTSLGEAVGEERERKKSNKPTTEKLSSTEKKQKDVRVSNSAGLPWDIQKALAQAIEADGGIAWFKMKPHSVKDICDRHPETFGLPGSRRRQQIRNKIKYWRTYSPDEYRSLLANFIARGPPVVANNRASNVTKAEKVASQVKLHTAMGQTVEEAIAQMQARQPDLFSPKMAMKSEAAAVKSEAAAVKKVERKKLPIRADQEYGASCCGVVC
jgi:hypothetical protein